MQNIPAAVSERIGKDMYTRTSLIFPFPDMQNVTPYTALLKFISCKDGFVQSVSFDGLEFKLPIQGFDKTWFFM